MPELLTDLAACIVAAWALGMMAHIARQPPLLAYLAAGFALGPGGVAIVRDGESIKAIAELGLLFLMFMVGLEIDLKKALSAGPAITITGACQLLGGFALGLLVFGGLGFPLAGAGGWDSLYLAVAAAMSSTVIIVKTLYERRELDTLAGRVTLGILVLQDLAAILFLAVQPSLDHLRASTLLLSALRVAGLVAATFGLTRYALPPLFHRVARSPELVLVGAIAWCFGAGQLAEWLGLSRAMGALAAGVSLSTFPYALDVAARVTSLRDFFVTLFFVGLGLKLRRPTVDTLGLAAGFMVFTAGSRLLTTFIPLYRLGFGLRHSLLPAIYLAQLSEFSLVILAMGAESKHIAPGIADGASVAFVALAFASSVALGRSSEIVQGAIPWLRRAGLRDVGSDRVSDGEWPDKGRAPTILVLGFHRTASSLLANLRRESPQLLRELSVVDFNPMVHARLRADGIRAIYGDISHRDTLIHAHAERAEIIVCTIPDSLLVGVTNERLVRQLRAINPGAKILAPAETLEGAARLRTAGANYVSLARQSEARDLASALLAARAGSLDQLQKEIEDHWDAAAETLP